MFSYDDQLIGNIGRKRIRMTVSTCVIQSRIKKGTEDGQNK